MKKHMMPKRYSASAGAGPDIAGMINKMQEQLVSLERKIDTLIGRPSQRPAEVKLFPRPFQQPVHTRSHGLARQDNSYRERTLHKAVCADCKKECEVPFAPSGDRPVYCKECFSKRKAGSPEGRPAASYRGGGSPHRERFNNRPREVISPQAIHINKPQSGERKNHAEKKKPDAKRRKARA